MAFTFSDEQHDFIEAVSQFLRDGARRLAAGEAVPEQIWTELVALDLPGLLIPEEMGGAGLATVDLVAVLEAAGRFALPQPLANTVAGFVPAVLLGSSQQQARKLLDRVLAGGTGALAPTWDCPSISDGPAARLDSGELAARPTVVPDAAADLVAVPALDVQSGESVLIVGSAEAVGVVPRDGMSGPRTLGVLDQEAFRLDGVTVLNHDVRAAFPTAWVGAAAELIGIATELVEQSAAFARDRVQFGHPIGHFQAVKHQLVDAHLQIERARSLTLYAALAIDERRSDAVRGAHRAKAAASDAASQAARSAVQVHGGAGITAEHPVSSLYLRARQKSMMFGGSDTHYGCDCLHAGAVAVTG